MKHKFILLFCLFNLISESYGQNPGYLGSVNAIQISSNLGMNLRGDFNVIPRIKYERSKNAKRSFSINVDLWAGSLTKHSNWYSAGFTDNNNNSITLVSGSVDYLNLSVELSKRYYKTNASAPYGKYWELAMANDFIKFVNDLTVWTDPDAIKKYPFQTAIITTLIVRYGIRRMLSDHIGLDLNAGFMFWKNEIDRNGPTNSGSDVVFRMNTNLFQTNIGLSYLF